MKKIFGFLFLKSAILPASAVVLGQVEDFSSGLGGWVEGDLSPNPPFIVSNGGPDGSAHLGNFSFGSGAGSRQAMFNTSSLWTGNYLGIQAITIDVRTGPNTANELNLRLGFDGPGGWFSTTAITVPVNGAWRSESFSLSEADLIYVSGGTGQYADTLSNVTTFQIFSAEEPLIVGQGGLIRADVVASELLIDNIATVPEPSSLSLLALVGLAAFRRSRKK